MRQKKNKHLEFKCYAAADAEGRFKACVDVIEVKNIAQNLATCICNWNAKKFSSLEELALNLELKFPGCRLEHESKMHEIVGISQEVLRELVNRREPLL